MQFIGVIRAFHLPGGNLASFSVPREREKVKLSYGLLGGISTQANTMGTSLHTFTSRTNLKPHNNFCYSQVG